MQWPSTRKSQIAFLLKAVATLWIGMGISAATNPDLSLPAMPSSSSKTVNLPDLPKTLDTPNSKLDAKTPEYVILQPSDEATFSSETTASILNLNVKEGSYFKTGDVLLEMDCRVQNADYKKAIAQQTANKIALKSAERLKSYDSISEFEVVKARAEAEMANAEVDKLSAILEKCTIKAPYNGAVANVMVHKHETVKPGDPLIKIVSTEHLIIQMEVPSDWLQWLHINSIFDVHINELDKTINAKIIRINPNIDAVSQTVKITGEIQPTTERLLPGMSGQALFPENPGKKSGVTKSG